jgi:hypothetical protein
MVPPIQNQAFVPAGGNVTPITAAGDYSTDNYGAGF